MNNYDFVASEQVLADNFRQGGGDEAKFWSGRMSMQIGRVLTADVMSLSNDLDILRLFKEKYDRVIIDRANWTDQIH